MWGARHSCPAGLLAVIAAVLLAALTGVEARADDAAVMRNLKYYCSNLNAPGVGPYDETLLRCQTIEDDPEIFQLALNQQIPNICRSIQEQCQAPGSDARKARLSNYLTTLSCAERGYTCLSGRGTRAGACDGGNINIVVKAIDEIERAGGVVSRSLRRAVRVYAEACALNRATQTALANVNTQMRAFYDDKYIGCVEAGTCRNR